jgi:hypothetical protein
MDNVKMAWDVMVRGNSKTWPAVSDAIRGHVASLVQIRFEDGWRIYRFRLHHKALFVVFSLAGTEGIEIRGPCKVD